MNPREVPGRMALPGEEEPGNVPDAAPGTLDAGAGGSLPSNVKTWAVGGHLAAFVWLIGIPGPIGPLIVWLLKRGDHPFIDEQAKEALNFQLSIVIYIVALGLLTVVFSAFSGVFGIPVLVAIAPGVSLVAIVALLAVVFAVIGAYHASEGEDHRYPLTLRLVS